MVETLDISVSKTEKKKYLVCQKVVSAMEKKKKRSSKESVRSARDWETCCSIKYSDQNRHHLKK